MSDSVRCADPGCARVYSDSLEKCDKCSLPKEKSARYFSNKKGTIKRLKITISILFISRVVLKH